MELQLHFGSMTRLRCLAAAVAIVVAACSPSSLVDVEPSGTLVDPLTVTTASGAVQLYNQAIASFTARYGGWANFGRGYDNVLVSSALFTDELMAVQSTQGTMADRVDERAGGFRDNNAGSYFTIYGNVHQPRIMSAQAREALRRFAPGSEVKQAEMAAAEAYVIIWFAEIWCNGIPLTAVPLDKPPVRAAGFTTDEMFERAIALFDTALTLASTDATVANVARVGKGRALLGLGRFADAATAVSSVPTDYIYQVEFDPTAQRAGSNTSSGTPGNNIGGMVGADRGNRPRVQIVDTEGVNGLVWTNDPRVGAMQAPAQWGAMWLPAKYSQNSAGVLQTAVTIEDNPIRLADGLEARLIEAEAALAAGDASWLTTLNMLRSTCIGAAPCAPVPGLTATSLPALADPGTPAARLDLLMSERAKWLYLTAHRQGDMRRMASRYGRDPNTLWPTGIYTNPGFAPFSTAPATHGMPYGPDFVMTPAFTEARNNPLYEGCFDQDP